MCYSLTDVRGAQERLGAARGDSRDHIGVSRYQRARAWTVDASVQVGDKYGKAASDAYLLDAVASGTNRCFHATEDRTKRQTRSSTILHESYRCKNDTKQC